MHQMETSAFAYAEVDPHELRMILRASHEAFIEFMLPDETQMNEGVEDFHLLIFGRFVDMKVLATWRHCRVTTQKRPICGWRLHT